MRDAEVPKVGKYVSCALGGNSSRWVASTEQARESR